MEILDLYNYLFHTMEGVGWLVVGVLVITFIMAILFERKIRKRYVDRGFKHAEDDWNDPDYDNELGMVVRKDEEKDNA